MKTTKVRDWVKFPSWWLPKLENLQYKNDMYGTSNGKIAALMIYIAILIESSKDEKFDAIKISYSTILTYTGISRSSIKKGLNVLERLNVIKIDKSHKHNSYTLIDPNGFSKKWFKFPANSLLNKEQNRIVAFNNFTLRTKTELPALKILLYIGSVRDNTELHSNASYNTLTRKLGISRNDIPKALSLLYINELLVKASPKESPLLESDEKYNQPNMYFLKGYIKFIKR